MTEEDYELQREQHYREEEQRWHDEVMNMEHFLSYEPGPETRAVFDILSRVFKTIDDSYDDRDSFDLAQLCNYVQRFYVDKFREGEIA